MHQCPRCELRFALRDEVDDHVRLEHGVHGLRLPGRPRLDRTDAAALAAGNEPERPREMHPAETHPDHRGRRRDLHGRGQDPDGPRGQDGP